MAEAKDYYKIKGKPLSRIMNATGSSKITYNTFKSGGSKVITGTKYVKENFVKTIEFPEYKQYGTPISFVLDGTAPQFRTKITSSAFGTAYTMQGPTNQFFVSGEKYHRYNQIHVFCLYNKTLQEWELQIGFISYSPSGSTLLETKYLHKSDFSTNAIPTVFFVEIQGAGGGAGTGGDGYTGNGGGGSGGYWAGFVRLSDINFDDTSTIDSFYITLGQNGVSDSGTSKDSKSENYKWLNPVSCELSVPYGTSLQWPVVTVTGGECGYRAYNQGVPPGGRGGTVTTDMKTGKIKTVQSLSGCNGGDAGDDQTNSNGISSYLYEIKASSSNYGSYSSSYKTVGNKNGGTGSPASKWILFVGTVYCGGGGGGASYFAEGMRGGVSKTTTSRAAGTGAGAGGGEYHVGGSDEPIYGGIAACNIWY